MPSPALILRSLFTEPIFFFLSVIAYLSPAPIPPWLSGFLLNVLGIDILQSHNYLPHHSAPFEGYYTRISTDSDATILIIFSTVRDAKPENKPNLLHFSYLPKERKGRGNEDDAIVINVFPGSIVYDGQAASVDSSLLEITATTSRADRGEPLGRYIVTPKEDGSEYLSYKLLLPEDNGEKSSTSPGGARTRSWISVSIDLGKREPWDGEVGGRHNTPASGPEGPVSALIHLLPLHWFVWSVGSPANVTIKRVIRPDGVKPTEVTMQPLRDDLIWAGKGRAHAEKNWGWSFPKGWVWIQSFTPINSDTPPPKPHTQPSTQAPLLNSRSSSSPPYIAVAGGSIIGLKAFLIGFRSSTSAHNQPQLDWTLRPPFSILFPILGLGVYASPFATEEYDCEKGFYKASVVDWTWTEGWRKLVITAQGPPGMPSPTSERSHRSSTSEIATSVIEGNLGAQTTFEVRKQTDQGRQGGVQETYDYVDLPCPLSTGHGNNFAKETFRAKVVVAAYVWRKTGGPGSRKEWDRVVREEFEKSALEWGGEYWGSAATSGLKGPERSSKETNGGTVVNGGASKMHKVKLL